MDRGVIYVAVGAKAAVETRLAIQALRRYHDWPVIVAGDRRVEGARWHEFLDTKGGKVARWAKTNLNKLSPFDQTLFMDADTRVYADVGIGFRLLDRGWDMVMVPSLPQGGQFLWHCTEDEREETLIDIPIDPLQLNTGVMWFRKCTRVDRFFVEWRRQWLRYRDMDQGAFVRALNRRPLALFTLSRHFNGGAAVGHRFGACVG